VLLTGCGAGPDGVTVELLGEEPPGLVLRLNATHFAEMPLLATLLDANTHSEAYPDAYRVNSTRVDYSLDRDSSRKLHAYLESHGLVNPFLVEDQGRYYSLSIYFLAC